MVMFLVQFTNAVNPNILAEKCFTVLINSAVFLMLAPGIFRDLLPAYTQRKENVSKIYTAQL